MNDFILIITFLYCIFLILYIICIGLYIFIKWLIREQITRKVKINIIEGFISLSISSILFIILFYLIVFKFIINPDIVPLIIILYTTIPIIISRITIKIIMKYK